MDGILYRPDRLEWGNFNLVQKCSNIHAVEKGMDLNARRLPKAAWQVPVISVSL